MATRQRLLRIGTPSDRPPLHASQLRELLARAGKGAALPPVFFHYDATGRTLPGPARIRTVGGRAWVGLLAINANAPESEEITAAFDAAVGIAARIVAEHYATPVPISIEEREYDAVALHYPVRYFFRDVAIKRRTDRRRALNDEALLRVVLAAALVSESERYGLDVPQEERLQVVVHSCRAQGLRLSTTQGLTNEFVHLLNGEISAHLDLRGIWQIGNLQARGYGRLIRVVPGLAECAPSPRITGGQRAGGLR